MDNTLVSARVPRAKKERASGVLDSIGATISDLVNSSLDYVIATKQLPRTHTVESRTSKGFATFVRDSTLDVDWSAAPRDMQEGRYADFMKRERLSDYESLA